MAKPERYDPSPREYIPEPNDPVTVEGVPGRLVVIGVDKDKKTAVVYATTTPVIRYTVEWSKLSRIG
ncbi:MAG TPA: hypothetical protein VN911_13310 [Candidatus Acidoferrum sp.]|nr:hypothetical protein [Candidatus Acidoferrum sp.]